MSAPGRAASATPLAQTGQIIASRENDARREDRQDRGGSGRGARAAAAKFDHQQGGPSASAQVPHPSTPRPWIPTPYNARPQTLNPGYLDPNHLHAGIKPEIKTEIDARIEGRKPDAGGDGGGDARGVWRAAPGRAARPRRARRGTRTPTPQIPMRCPKPHHQTSEATAPRPDTRNPVPPKPLTHDP